MGAGGRRNLGLRLVEPVRARAVVGREETVARLVSGWAAGALLVVAGEPGIGKTTVLQELSSQVSTEAAVLWGATVPHDRAPFAPILRAVAPQVARWTAVPPALARHRRALAAALGEGAPDIWGSPANAPGRREVARAVAELVHVAGSGRGLLVVEDLQWVDDDSVSVLTELVRRGEIAVAVSVRPDELLADGPACAFLHWAHRSAVTVEERLHGLHRGAARQLMAELVGVDDAAAADAAFERSGGHPLLLQAAAGAAGDPESADSLTTALDAARRQLAGLRSLERRLVDVLAIAGPDAPFDDVRALAEVDEASCASALSRLVDLGLVREWADDRFDFTSHLVRESASTSMLSRRRRELHGRALARLGEGEDARRVVHAQACGADHELLGAAGREAERALADGVPGRALRLAKLLLSVAPDDQYGFDVAARAAWACGDATAAMGYAHQLVAAAEGGEEMAAALSFLLRLAWEAGDVGARSSAIRRLQDLLPELASPKVRAAALAALSEATMLDGDGDAAIDLARAALAEARVAGDQPLVASGLVNLGSVLVDAPTTRPDGIDQLRAGLQAAIHASDAHTELRARSNIVHSTVLEAGFDARAIDELAGAARRAGRDEWARPIVDLWRGIEAELLGDAGLLDLLVAPWLDVRTAASACVRLLAVGQAIERGDLDAADRLLHDVAADVRPDREYDVWLRSLAVQIDAFRSPPGAARALFRLLDEPPHRTLLSVDRIGRAVLAVVASVPAHARETLDAAQPWLGADGATWLAHGRAVALEASGEAPQAAATYLASVDGSTLRRPAMHLADARCRRAAILLAAGDRAAARAEATAATDLLARWPGWRRDAARSVLRAAGGRPVSTAPGVLSAREQEVADLVALGLTNAQIAQRLFISARTVSVHVSHALAKIGGRRRTEIASWVAQNRGASS